MPDDFTWEDPPANGGTQPGANDKARDDEAIRRERLKRVSVLISLIKPESMAPDEIGRHVDQAVSLLAEFASPIEAEPLLQKIKDITGISIETLRKQFAARAKTADKARQHKTQSNGADEPKDEISELVAEFNEQYAVVLDSGKTLVYKPTDDPVIRRRVLIRITFDSLHKLYQNWKITKRYPEGGSVTKSAADWWLDDPRRRTYKHGTIFDPTGKERYGYWNLWSGYSVKPQPGDWSLMREHVERIICAGNSEHSEYLFNWTARMFQMPQEPGEVAIVTRGVEGVGKSIWFACLARAYGQHGLQISSAEHLVGRFNLHLRDLIFLFADEAFLAGDRRSIGKLKAFITEKILPIEGKGLDLVTVLNMLHIAMASNEDWVVPASIEARRYLMLDVPDSRKGNFEYFTAIDAQMRGEDDANRKAGTSGLAAMLYDMLHRDIREFNPRVIPDSKALDTQKLYSADTVDQWQLTVLERGYVYRSRYGLPRFAKWETFVTTELLDASYHQWCSDNRKLPENRVTLGRRLTEIYQPQRPRGKYPIGEVESPLSGTNDPDRLIHWGEHPHGYQLGELELARFRFTEVRKLAPDGGWMPVDDGRE